MVNRPTKSPKPAKRSAKATAGKTRSVSKATIKPKVLTPKPGTQKVLEQPGAVPQATERRILAAAREEFISHGLVGARMRPIAQRAGVNAALLHYYFRNKEKLYEAALLDTVHSVWGGFEEAVADEKAVRATEGDLPVLVRRILGRYLEVVLAHPEFPRFMLREIVDGGRHLPMVIATVRQKYGPFLQRIFATLQQQIAAGRLRPIAPVDFFLNLGGLTLSSVLYVLIAGHFQGAQATENGFRERRIEEIVTTLFDGLRVQP